MSMFSELIITAKIREQKFNKPLLPRTNVGTVDNVKENILIHVFQQNMLMVPQLLKETSRGIQQKKK